MKIYTVYFYYNQWSDSYETDRLYFTSYEKAREHEKNLLKENSVLIQEDDNHGVMFEEITVIN
ncbi:hypothetical protein JTF06_12170 [Desemzia sp. RIT804]|uniref:hypothetical protein n=1 Tax=Desemzia sp. RIT 804 TaxID=2810209 RepID=UPI001951C8DF|nr:hypothetical protein [Desemzia sp. RIT 804]MBM6615642.1 hypothetical protein [Desemzia sp. RIT 804]